jgi:hypothetical protein
MIVATRSFLLGLVSFMDQATLSLDRIPSHDLSKLIAFYRESSKHKLRDVVDRLERINRGECAENRFDLGTNRSQKGLPYIIEICMTAVKVGTFREAVIKDSRLWFAERALRRLEQLLTERASWEPGAVHDVRIELAHAASLVASAIRPRSKRDSVGQVFHLNHAETLSVKSVEDIAGEDWFG